MCQTHQRDVVVPAAIRAPFEVLEQTECTKPEAERQCQTIIAGLQHQRDEAKARADETAELARQRGRGFIGRHFSM